MKFKRPYWLLLFISLGCLVLGFTAFMLGTPDVKSEEGLRFWTSIVGEILILLGAVGFVGSLLWMFFSGFDSDSRPQSYD